MRLVFVHGMRQEGKMLGTLRKSWEGALISAWRSAGLGVPDYELEMPFFGDVLDELTEKARGGAADIVARGVGAASPFTRFEIELLTDMAINQGISDQEIRKELNLQVVEQSPPNWQWVQGIARVLEKKLPLAGDISLRFVRQVDAYLTRPHIRQAVDEIVKPALTRGRIVLVAHSLGSVVSYTLLRAAGKDADVSLFVTLGCPLGIEAVKRRIRPPALRVPIGVCKWVNGNDIRDYVGLKPRLDRTTFAEGIENVSDIRNGHYDAHSIIDYLTDSTISQKVHAALQAG